MGTFYPQITQITQMGIKLMRGLVFATESEGCQDQISFFFFAKGETAPISAAFLLTLSV
jgi:hypothetical protein